MQQTGHTWEAAEVQFWQKLGQSGSSALMGTCLQVKSVAKCRKGAFSVEAKTCRTIQQIPEQPLGSSFGGVGPQWEQCSGVYLSPG